MLSLAVLVLFIASTMSLTYGERIISTHGVLETEGVDISIKATQDKKLLAPNMTVRYHPVITYKGVDAYIRFKLDISTEDIELYQFSGLSQDWVHRGDYFYYVKPVKHNTKLDTFRSFHIPAEYDEGLPVNFMASDFDITATCDAVQARNFTPDFSSEAPWGELEIQDNTYNGNTYKGETVRSSEPIRINFKGASQYSLSSDEMIRTNILPGDTCKNSINLTNQGKNDLEVFFSVSEENQEEMYNLLDALELTIKLDGKPFYQGTLRASELNQWRTLLTMEEGSRHRLSYEIHGPEELDNAYQEKLNHFTWNFKVKEEQTMPYTGDRLLFIFWSAVLIAAFAVILLLRKGEKDEE